MMTSAPSSTPSTMPLNSMLSTPSTPITAQAMRAQAHQSRSMFHWVLSRPLSTGPNPPYRPICMKLYASTATPAARWWQA